MANGVECLQWVCTDREIGCQQHKDDRLGMQSPQLGLPVAVGYLTLHVKFLKINLVLPSLSFPLLCLTPTPTPASPYTSLCSCLSTCLTAGPQPVPALQPSPQPVQFSRSCPQVLLVSPPPSSTTCSLNSIPPFVLFVCGLCLWACLGQFRQPCRSCAETDSVREHISSLGLAQAELYFISSELYFISQYSRLQRCLKVRQRTVTLSFRRGEQNQMLI